MEGKKNCVGGYYRIRKGKEKDPKAVYRTMQKGYGVKHPERISGYAGLFFGTGDVYVSEAVGECMDDGEFREFVFDSLKLFEREGYGDVSSGDVDMNGESRWFGNGDRVFGRYGFFREKHYLGKKQYDEVIRIRMWKGNTWITYDSEMDLFLLLKDNRQEPESGKEEKDNQSTAAENTEEDKTEEKEGPEFLMEYRAHSEKYLPMTFAQYGIYNDQEKDHMRYLFWNAGIIEENRPFFAIFRKSFHVTSVAVYVSAEGMESWDAEHLLIPKMIRRGLLEVDDVRKIPPAAYRVKDRTGHEFYMVDIVLEDEKPTQNVRWIGKKHTFMELTKVNVG